MAAAVFGLPACVQLLLDAGANVHTKTQYGNNAALLASRFGQDETLSILLDNTDMHAKDNDGHSFLRLAAERGNTDSLRKLSERGSEFSRNIREWRDRSHVVYDLSLKYERCQRIITLLMEAAKERAKNASLAFSIGNRAGSY